MSEHPQTPQASWREFLQDDPLALFFVLGVLLLLLLVLSLAQVAERWHQNELEVELLKQQAEHGEIAKPSFSRRPGDAE